MSKRIYRKFSPQFIREAVRLAEQANGPITFTIIAYSVLSLLSEYGQPQHWALRVDWAKGIEGNSHTLGESH
jgi:hypothetical protein